jgi:hypothetical protein
MCAKKKTLLLEDARSEVSKRWGEPGQSIVSSNIYSILKLETYTITNQLWQVWSW